MIKKVVFKEIQNAVLKYLESINENIDNINSLIEISYCVDDKFGDYASPIAMKLAKGLKKNPFDIANSIIEKINTNIFDKVEVARPGFINMTLSKDYINSSINNLLKDDNYGRNTVEEKENILIEYVSANPTGPLHIGHGRWAAIGSTLSNVLKYVGHNVYQEFYVNDAGEQITKLNESVKAVKEGLV